MSHKIVGFLLGFPSDIDFQASQISDGLKGNQKEPNPFGFWGYPLRQSQVPTNWESILETRHDPNALSILKQLNPQSGARITPY